MADFDEKEFQDADPNEVEIDFDDDSEVGKDDADLADQQDADDDQSGEDEGEGRDWEAEARAQGWHPKGGDKTAQEFVEFGEKRDAARTETLHRTIAEHKVEIEALKRANRAALKRQKENIERDYASREREAVSMGDVAAFDKIREERAETLKQYQEPPAPPQIDPKLQAWGAQNTWYTGGGYDGEKAFANATLDTLMRNNPGKSEADLLPELDAAMQRTFPALYGATPRRQPRPVTDKGGRRGSGKSKTKGVADLPKDALQAGKEYVEDGIFKSLEDYAAAFHAQG